jgi:agmatinase
MSERYAFLDRYEFDFEGELFAGRAVKGADCGDVVRGPEPFADYADAVTETLRGILEQGSVPIVLGGDHGTTIPVLGAYEGHGPLCVVQIDAHLDWIDQRDGVYNGFSSPMRRASEHPWVSSMAQIGLRGQGSARRGEVEAALACGKCLLVRAEELHREGMEAVLARIPQADKYYLTVDMDGMDPAIAPGVPITTPGGVTYYQALELLRGLARKGKIVGVDIVEVVPAFDVANLTTALVVRLLLDFIGVLAHNGHIGA